jgi:hypothetical protein
VKREKLRGELAGGVMLSGWAIMGRISRAAQVKLARTPPWRRSFRRPWPPEPSRRKAPTQDQIRARAYRLSKMSPWRTTAENWEAAERELSRPKIARWTKSIFDWFGFSEKKGWDWLEFLARVSFPVVIAIGGWYWAGENSKQQQQINQALQKDLVVSEYIKNIQQLVLEKNLSTAEPAEPVSAIARSLTLTALTRLREADSEQLSVHKGQILQFLHETGLITQRSNKRHVLVSNANLLLNGADLSGANLTGGDLSGASLIGANLNGADLARAYLRGTYFYAGYLRGASLREALIKTA